MRLCSTASVLSALVAMVCAVDFCAADARAEDAKTSDSGASNSANDPTEPKLTVENWNYYAPSLNNLDGGADNGEARILIPYQINGVQQLFHIDPPIVTNPTAKTRPRTGLGDAQICALP